MTTSISSEAQEIMKWTNVKIFEKEKRHQAKTQSRSCELMSFEA